MTNPKVSVIVPVYKVEPYLRKCLDSIVGQTYRNLEIILVDDGSPDNCGVICDEYAARDERIIVIHQENGGLSAARNSGLDVATGVYLGFVDSDDWIEPDMIEYLMDGVRESSAQMVQCAISLDYGGQSKKIGYDRDVCMNAAQAIGELLKNARFTNHVWNKLFHAPLFRQVRFPVGRVYEDFSVMYQLMDRARCVMVRAEQKYHYTMRTSGIVLSDRFTDRLDCWTATNERYQYLCPKYPQYEQLLTVDMTGSVMGVWSVAWVVRGQVMGKYRQLMREMAVFAKAHYKVALKHGNYGITGRLRLRLTPYDRSWAYLLAYILNRIYKWKFAG